MEPKLRQAAGMTIAVLAMFALLAAVVWASSFLSAINVTTAATRATQDAGAAPPPASDSWYLIDPSSGRKVRGPFADLESCLPASGAPESSRQPQYVCVQASDLSPGPAAAGQTPAPPNAQEGGTAAAPARTLTVTFTRATADSLMGIPEFDYAGYVTNAGHDAVFNPTLYFEVYSKDRVLLNQAQEIPAGQALARMAPGIKAAVDFSEMLVRSETPYCMRIWSKDATLRFVWKIGSPLPFCPPSFAAP